MVLQDLREHNMLYLLRQKRQQRHFNEDANTALVLALKCMLQSKLMNKNKALYSAT